MKRSAQFKIKLEDRAVIEHFCRKAAANGGILAPSEVRQLVAASQAFMNLLSWLSVTDRRIADRDDAGGRSETDLRMLEDIWFAVEQFGVEMPP